MITCPAAFKDNLLQDDFPITDAARSVDFYRKSWPETDINYYAVSLTDIRLQELHHALNFIRE